MSKKRLQAFAAGMILSTSVLAGTYLLSGNNNEKTANKETTEQEVQQYLVKNNQKVITSAEYDELLKLKEAAAKQQQQEAVKAAQKEVPEAEQQPKPYTLNIKQGMSTSEVSQILEDAGMINSANDFNTYLIEAKYHTKVRAGTFELQSGMSFAEIANVLTK